MEQFQEEVGIFFQFTAAFEKKALDVILGNIYFVLVNIINCFNPELGLVGIACGRIKR